MHLLTVLLIGAGGWGEGGLALPSSPQGDIPDKRKFHPVTNGQFPPIHGGGSFFVFHFVKELRESLVRQLPAGWAGLDLEITLGYQLLQVPYCGKKQGPIP